MDSGNLGGPGGADGLLDVVEELARWCGFQEINWKWRSESVRLCVR